MTATLYIIKDDNAYKFGLAPAVRLWEPKFLSRTWIRRVTVELPNEFCVAESTSGEPMIFRGSEHYDLATDKNEDPVIIDHTERGAYIRLNILEEGWD